MREINSDVPFYNLALGILSLFVNVNQGLDHKMLPGGPIEWALPISIATKWRIAQFALLTLKEYILM